MRSSKIGIVGAGLMMAAAMLGGQVATGERSISVERPASADRQAAEAVKAEKKRKQAKAARLGSGYYRYFKFPRSRKTTTAARLKRASTKRRNIAKRGRK